MAKGPNGLDGQATGCFIVSTPYELCYMKLLECLHVISPNPPLLVGILIAFLILIEIEDI